MHLPRLRFTKLAAAALAGVVVLSTLVGPSLLPAGAGGNAARAEVIVEINAFEDALSPYGSWIDSPSYGQVWYPTGVHRGWRPYYDDGHWAYSDDYGWMWVSDAPWGWAPFHYGRWVFDPYYGWIWVPGRVWGPAWVTFRWADDCDCIGWAPLPPDVGWDPRYGYRGGGDINIDISFWSFVRPEGFTARRFDRYAFDRQQYPILINRTTNITNITVINNRIVNNSIRVKDIERITHQRVERLKVTESDRPQGTVIKGNKVVLYKPAVVEQGQAKASANKKLHPALIKEDPAQDNKKRFAETNKQLKQQQQPKLQQQQQQPKLQQQQQQPKLQQQQQQPKLQQQQQQPKLQQQQQPKLQQQQQQPKLQQQQQPKLKQQQQQQQQQQQPKLQQQQQQPKLQQQQQQPKLKQQQQQGQPGKKGKACGGPGQPPCQ